MFSLFKKKEKKQEYLYEKIIPYNGYTVFVWAKEYHNENSPEILQFSTGWSVADAIKGEYYDGEYYTGTSAERLRERIVDNIICAQKFVDKLLDKPSKFKEAIESLKDI